MVGAAQVAGSNPCGDGQVVTQGHLGTRDCDFAGGAIELERKEKRIGSSLEAHPVIHAFQEDISLFDDLDAAELFITSGADFSPNAAEKAGFSIIDMPHVTVLPNQADGEKCGRCWKILSDVGQAKNYPEVCSRCADAVHYMTNDF